MKKLTIMSLYLFALLKFSRFLTYWTKKIWWREKCVEEFILYKFNILTMGQKWVLNAGMEPFLTNTKMSVDWGKGSIWIPSTTCQTSFYWVLHAYSATQASDACASLTFSNVDWFLFELYKNNLLDECTCRTIESLELIKR